MIHDSDNRNSNADYFIVAIGMTFILLLLHLPRYSFNLAPLGDNGQYYLRAVSLAKEFRYLFLEGVIPDYKIMLAAAPGIPFLLALWMKLAGTSIFSAKLGFLLLQILSAFVLFFSSRTFLKFPYAVLVTGLFYAAPEVVRFSGSLYVDIPFTALAAYCLCRLNTSTSTEVDFKSFNWIRIGILFGCLTAVRYAGIGWVVGAFIYLAYLFLWKRSKENLLKLLYFLVGAGSIILSLIIWALAHKDNFFSTYSGIVENKLFVAAGAQGYADLLWITALKFIQNCFNLFMYGTHARTYEVIILHVLVAAGVILNLKKRLTWMILLFLTVGNCAYFAAGNLQGRYMFPSIFLLWMLVAMGLQQISCYTKTIGLRRIGVAVLAVLFTILFLRSIPMSLVSIREGSNASFTQQRQVVHLQELCDWLKKHYKPEETVLGIHTRRALVHAWSGFIPTFKISELLSQSHYFAFSDKLIDKKVLVVYIQGLRGAGQINALIKARNPHLKLLHEIGASAVYEFDILGYYQDHPQASEELKASLWQNRPWLE